MINERREAKGYLSGEFMIGNAYRMCYMIARYLKSRDIQPKETLVTITEWARTHCVELDFSLQQCVYNAYKNTTQLENIGDIGVSAGDIDKISRFAHTRREKLLALALLCCAKAFGDADGVFEISFTKLANWIGYDASNLRKRDLENLKYFGIVEIVGCRETFHGWNNEPKKNHNRYKLKFAYDKDGEFKLENNNIIKLCDTVFPEAKPLIVDNKIEGHKNEVTRSRS